MNTTSDANWKSLYTIGAAAVLLQLATTLALIVITAALGTKPLTAQEYFAVYQESKLAGVLRDDFTSLFIIALYLGTIPALYFALRKVNAAYTTLAALFALVGVAVCFATHSGFSMLHLSDQYAAATTDAQRAQFLAAGEAIIAADMWNSSGAYMSGILLQGAGVILSLVMLRSKDFSKITAYAGLLGNGFDLIQHILHPFAPAISSAIILFMGLFYLAWFPMLARDLLKLGRNKE